MLVTRTPDALRAAAHAVIDAALAQYAPSQVFALFSGGHDSLSVTHVTAQHPAFSGVIHVNTGIGIPETNQFVRDTCAAQGWPLHELHPTWAYAQLVVRYGFPGAASHGFMYRYLKERPLMAFVQKQKRRLVSKSGKATRPDPKDRIMLVGGMRSQESVRRMGHVEPVHQDGAVVWVSPIHDWSAHEVGAYVDAAGLPRNPVKDTLHISGECLCGSFADENEERDLQFWYPATHAELLKYRELVHLASTLRGNPIPAVRCRWGWDGSRSLDQQELFPMCHYCTAGRATERAA